MSLVNLTFQKVRLPVKIDIYYSSDVGCCADVHGKQKLEGCKDEIEALEVLLSCLKEGLLGVSERKNND